MSMSGKRSDTQAYVDAQREQFAATAAREKVGYEAHVGELSASLDRLRGEVKAAKAGARQETDMMANAVFAMGRELQRYMVTGGSGAAPLGPSPGSWLGQQRAAQSPFLQRMQRQGSPGGQ